MLGYLTVKENHAAPHKLLGQVHEALADYSKAVTAYKRSLELDPNQKQLVLKSKFYFVLTFDDDIHCKLTSIMCFVNSLIFYSAIYSHTIEQLSSYNTHSNQTTSVLYFSTQIELQPHKLYQNDQKSHLYNFISVTPFDLERLFELLGSHIYSRR